MVENKKVGKRRYITKLFTDTSGMNPKSNSSIGTLAFDINTEIEQEKKINNDIENAIGKLTCNIGNIINSIRNEGV